MTFKGGRGRGGGGEGRNILTLLIRRQIWLMTGTPIPTDGRYAQYRAGLIWLSSDLEASGPGFEESGSCYSDFLREAASYTVGHCFITT